MTDWQNMKEVWKKSYLSYGGLPSALRSSKLIRRKSTKKEHSFFTFNGRLVHNIPGPGLKFIDTRRLVDKDFPKISIGFWGSPSRNLWISEINDSVCLEMKRKCSGKCWEYQLTWSKGSKLPVKKSTVQLCES